MLVMLAMQSATQHLGECSGCCSSWAPAVRLQQSGSSSHPHVWAGNGFWQCMALAEHRVLALIVLQHWEQAVPTNGHLPSDENRKQKTSPPPNTFG